jgi:hypothetical protein
MPTARTLVMVSLTAPDPAPTLERIARQYGLPLDALDPEFGVIAVSPDEGVYTVRVDAAWAHCIDPQARATFPEVPIGTLGPPEEVAPGSADAIPGPVDPHSPRR